MYHEIIAENAFDRTRRKPPVLLDYEERRIHGELVIGSGRSRLAPIEERKARDDLITEDRREFIPDWIPLSGDPGVVELSRLTIHEDLRPPIGGIIHVDIGLKFKLHPPMIMRELHMIDPKK